MAFGHSGCGMKQGPASFFCKVLILGHVVSVIPTQICHYGVKAVVGQVNRQDRATVKLYLQKLMAGWSLLAPHIEDRWKKSA